MDSGAVYRGALVAQVAGVPLRTLQRWIVDGFAPCAKDVKGTGNKRRFTFGDIVRAKALGELRAKGADVRTLKRAVAILAAEYGEGDPLGEGRLVVLQGRVYWREDDKAVVDLLRGQRVIKDLILVDMGEIAQEAKARVEALAA